MLHENLQEKPARVILTKIYLKKEFMLKAVPIKKKAFTDLGENELGEILKTFNVFPIAYLCTKMLYRVPVL